MKRLAQFCGLATAFAVVFPVYAGSIPNVSVGKVATEVASVPEPVTLLLFGAGILALAALSRKRHAASVKQHS